MYKFCFAVWMSLSSCLNIVMADQPIQPTAVVKSLQDTLIDAMKNSKSLGYQGRYDRLAPVIEQTHDLAYIARFAIGKKNWDRLDAEQQSRYVDVFSDYSIATYAFRFNDYDGEVFQIDSEKPMKRGRVQVLSHLKITGQQTEVDSIDRAGMIDFNYVLREHEGRWVIINIVVQGVSDLALKRAEYKTLISEKGFDALMTHIEDKTRAYTNSVR